VVADNQGRERQRAMSGRIHTRRSGKQPIIMPYINVRGIAIRYEVFGDRGPWVALSPGGRSGYAEFVSLARKIATGGFRVLLHDRRNCGASDISFDDSQGEDAHRVDDLHELLSQLNALPAFIGGSSSGCRMSLLYYLRHREAVLGLLLLRATGGSFPADRLPENYYGQFIRAAEQGGMAAVSKMDHWRDCINARPANASILMSISSGRFISAMSFWRDQLCVGANHPVIGVSEAELRSIAVPTIVLPGNDRLHSRSSGRLAHRLIPNAELHELPIHDTGVELVPFSEWAPQEDEIASVLTAFMRRGASVRASV
jgi:pimeloyl-ACP methyl ester carboxylesterase